VLQTIRKWFRSLRNLMTFAAITSTIVSPAFATCRMAMGMCTNMRIVGEKAET
jgi:hypothetical protein